MLKKKINKKKNLKKFNFYKNFKNLKNLIIFHIHASFNNTIVTVTDLKGNTVFWSTSVNSGFKGCKKSTFFAAQSAAEKAAREMFNRGHRWCKIFIKGTGIGRDFSIRGIFNSGIDIISVYDLTSIPHNGCKPKKLRRN